MKKTITWVLVADGSRAAIYRNDGPGRGLEALPDRRFEIELPPDRALRDDRPGRSFESASEARHAMSPPTDFHRREKEWFAEQLAGAVEQAAKTGDYDRLVIVAPPQALGNLRDALGDHAKARLAGELNKDLTAMKPDEIASRLGDIFAV